MSGLIPILKTYFDARIRHFKTYFDALLVDNNTGKKIFAKYLSADGCFVKTNTINCDDNDNAMFPITRGFAFTRQPMKRNFAWSTRAIHLRSSSVFLWRLKFWFTKKLKMNLSIAPTDMSFCKYQDHAKILIVFRRWRNCLCEIQILKSYARLFSN